MSSDPETLERPIKMTRLSLDFDHPDYQRDLACALNRLGPIPQLAMDRLSAEFCLRYMYPNEHVAFLDVKEGPEESQRLVRYIIAHSPSWEAVSDAVNQLDTSERNNVELTYNERIGETLFPGLAHG